MLKSASQSLKLFVISLGFIGAACLMGCGNSSDTTTEFKIASSQASAALPKEVRIAWGGGPRVWALGKAQGDFEQAFGTQVKWVEFATGSDVLSYFAANEIDIARFGSSPTIAGISRGLPIEIVGLEGLVSKAEGLIVRPEIKSLHDLAGKKVAFPPNSTAQYAFEQALKLENIDKTKIKMLPLKPAEIVSAWVRGDIDAAYTWQPFTQQLMQEGGHEIVSTSDLNKKGVLVFNNFAVRKAFAEKYPDLVVKFLQTYQAQVDAYQQDPKAVSEKIANYLSLPYEQVSLSLAGIEYIPLKEQSSAQYLGAKAHDENSGIAKASYSIAQFLVSTGELKSSDLPQSFAPSINNQYLQEAVK